MKGDDADHLMQLLNMLVPSTEEKDRQDLLYALELQIWPPEHNREHNCGLVAIAAGNIRGVPAAGALQCLRALIDWAPVWHREYRLAINRARKCGLDRSNAIQLLLHHARVQYPRKHRKSKQAKTGKQTKNRNNQSDSRPVPCQTSPSTLATLHTNTNRADEDISNRFRSLVINSSEM